MNSVTSKLQTLGETKLTPSENAARRALEAGASRAFTDLGWERARQRLLEFVALLVEWNRQTDTAATRTEKVLMVRDPERTSDTGLDEAA